MSVVYRCNWCQGKFTTNADLRAHRCAPKDAEQQRLAQIPNPVPPPARWSS